jgi:hypothetical protein
VNRFRAVVVASAVVALMVSALGAPVAVGASGWAEVVIVNGIPGTNIDICLNGKEVRSGLPYGSKIVKKRIARTQELKVYKADPRRCAGTKLARKSIPLVRDDDKTIVVTKNKPRKVLVFDNDFFPPGSTGASGPLVMRHAADLGTVRFVGQTTLVHPGPFSHANVPEWSKGHEGTRGIPVVPGLSMAVLHVERLSSRVIAGPVTAHLPGSYRHEWILVGTKARNAKIVSFKRPSEPTE